jgi:hypothetical protein
VFGSSSLHRDDFTRSTLLVSWCWPYCTTSASLAPAIPTATVSATTITIAEDTSITGDCPLEYESSSTSLAPISSRMRSQHEDPRAAYATVSRVRVRDLRSSLVIHS